MSTVKLLSNLQTENGVIAEGEVVDLPAEQADHLIALGAAEATDGAVTADPKAPEVEPAADPLAEQTAGPSEEPTQPEVAPEPEQPTPETPTQDTPASSSTNLHLG